MKEPSFPTAQQLKDELKREKYKSKYSSALRGSIWTLIVVAAAAIICTTFFFSVLRVEGNSMDPTLTKGELVIAVKTNNIKRGDIAAFYYNNMVLLKRTIGLAGDTVNIDSKGNVSVNNSKLDEPYTLEKCLGDSDIKFPFIVPDSRLFVLGDHRSTSTDSRSSMIGTVTKEQLVGKVVIRFWPISAFKIF